MSGLGNARAHQRIFDPVCSIQPTASGSTQENAAGASVHRINESERVNEPLLARDSRRGVRSKQTAARASNTILEMSWQACDGGRDEKRLPPGLPAAGKPPSLDGRAESVRGLGLAGDRARLRVPRDRLLIEAPQFAHASTV